MALTWLDDERAPLAVQRQLGAKAAQAPQPAVWTDAVPADGSAVDPTIAPFNGIVKIYDTIGGKNYEASGVLISPTEVLTASHVVYSQGAAPATDITVALGSGADTTTARNIHYNPVDDANGKESLITSEGDYALIHLATPLYPDSQFGLLTNYTGGVAAVGGYPSDGPLMTATGETDLLPGYSILAGPGLGAGSSGGPVWVQGSDGQTYVVGLVSTGNDGPPAIGYNVQITPDVLNKVESWIAQDGGAPPALTAVDTSLDQSFTPQVQGYSGPVSGLGGQYINISSDNLNLTANVGNLFLHSGFGEDAIQALRGTNVLDGGTGSNFLVGGSGQDTFFTDDRAAAAPIWDTLANFHAGDAATIFGVTQAGFSLNWADGEGAAGYTGLTVHATSPGTQEASVTLSGYTGAALTNGQLSLSYGVTNGTPYLYIHGNT